MQKLSIDLIPKNAWWKNARAVVSSLEWSILRWRFGASLEEPISNNDVLCGKLYRGNDYLLCGGVPHTIESYIIRDTLKSLLTSLCQKAKLVPHFVKGGLGGFELFHLVVLIYVKLNNGTFLPNWTF